ncbi:hypothetical protein CSW60_22150 [Caulobacter sp. X]|nr:hypothetical protein CSW60_22150 [Caulobacter sp. X]
MEKPNWDFYGGVKLKKVPAEGVPGGTMIEADVLKKGSNFWDAAAVSQPIKAIGKGKIVTLGFFARAASDDGPVWLNANVGRIEAPYDTAIIARVKLDQEARFYCVEGVSKIDLANKAGKVTLHLAGEKQKIDLGPFLVTVRDEQDGPGQLPCAVRLGSW